MISTEELEGRRPRGTSKNGKMVDDDGINLGVAIFDKGRASSADPVTRIGLGGPVGFIPSFRRSEADARPFKVVPFHEPDPDRIAKAEALRLRLAAQDEERMARGVSPEVVYASRDRHTNGTKRIPDIPNPDTSKCCGEDEAVIRGERNGRVLFWRSLMDAEAAFGARRDRRRIQAAVSPSNPTIDPYGWRWTRVDDGRRDNGGQNKGVRG